MRVLCGGPTRETTSDVFALHREGLEAQGSADFEIDIRHEVVEDDDGPRWHGAKIERVARVRQLFLNAVRGVNPRELGELDMMARYGGDCQALLMVDSDVILGPGVLARMWAVDAPVVFGCFWTEAAWGQPEGPTAPQCWHTHPFSFDRATWEALKAPGVNEVPVNGGGACTLIRGRGFESRYWPLLESIRYGPGMMAGEDRGFCLGLECRSLKQIAVTGLPIVHLYEQQTPAALHRARVATGLAPYADKSDMVVLDSAAAR